MAAAVSGFLGFAISKVVDQFWTPTPEPEEMPEHIIDNNSVELAAEPATTPVEPTTPTKPTQRKNANTRRAPRRKMQPIAKTIEIELPLDVKARSYSDPAELASNASTCGSSDDEDEAEVEDIGAKEMRLMLERAQQIKRLTKQSRQQQRQKESRSKTQAAKPKEEATAKAAPVPAPTRIQNTTTGLWKWSVYSGFAVDTRIANRGPRNMRHLYCTLGEAETLESEELFLGLAAQVLADN